jgi:hypothetical protein
LLFWFGLIRSIVAHCEAAAVTSLRWLIVILAVIIVIVITVIVSLIVIVVVDVDNFFLLVILGHSPEWIIHWFNVTGHF